MISFTPYFSLSFLPQQKVFKLNKEAIQKSINSQYFLLHNRNYQLIWNLINISQEDQINQQGQVERRRQMKLNINPQENSSKSWTYIVDFEQRSEKRVIITFSLILGWIPQHWELRQVLIGLWCKGDELLLSVRVRDIWLVRYKLYFLSNMRKIFTC